MKVWIIASYGEESSIVEIVSTKEKAVDSLNKVKSDYSLTEETLVDHGEILNLENKRGGYQFQAFSYEVDSGGGVNF